MRLPYNDPANNGQSFSRVAKLIARAFSRLGGASFGRSNSAAKRCFQRAYFGGEYAPQMSPPMIREDSRKLSKRPLKIGDREATALPVRHRLFDAQAIEIDRDVDIFAGETFRKFFKTLAPIIAQNCALPLSIFHRPIVCPRMHFKNSGAFGATIAENLVRPPAFEIAATPNTRKPHIWKFQCAIDPSATGPFRRAHIPIGMIIEGDEDDRFGNRTQPERCQMVKIAGAIEQERRRKIRLVLPIELFDQPRRRGETQPRPPTPRIGYRKADRFVRPRVIEIEMKRAVAQDHRCAAGKSSASAAFATRRFSSASLYPGLRRSASLNWTTAWEI